MVKWENLCKHEEFGGLSFSDTRIRRLNTALRWVPVMLLEMGKVNFSYLDVWLWRCPLKLLFPGIFPCSEQQSETVAGAVVILLSPGLLGLLKGKNGKIC
jgi:hypothetical protein